MTLQRSLYGTKAHNDTVLFQQVMNDLAAPFVFFPTPKNRCNDVVRKFMWMMKRAAAFRWNVIRADMITPANPTHDRRRLVSQMAGDGTHAPTQADELHGLPSNAREVWIGCVRHIRHFDMGCCQAIEPLQCRPIKRCSSEDLLSRGIASLIPFRCSKAPQRDENGACMLPRFCVPFR